LPSALPPLRIIPQLPVPAHLLYTQALAVIPERQLTLSDHCYCCHGHRCCCCYSCCCCCCTVLPGCHGSACRGRLSENEKRKRGAPGIPRRGHSCHCWVAAAARRGPKTKKGEGAPPHHSRHCWVALSLSKNKREVKKEGRGGSTVSDSPKMKKRGQVPSTALVVVGWLCRYAKGKQKTGEGHTWVPWRVLLLLSLLLGGSCCCCSSLFKKREGAHLASHGKCHRSRCCCRWLSCSLL
jgi:hypothetical protein